ncbi:hypothetical protein K3495_g10135 [Podosphaera aphanis]|nr:hypothetical protein K3495_g10135 [Podosphaera aphanis]
MSEEKSALKILLVNVGRSSVAHELALQIAFQTRAVLLLVQEPYVSRDLNHRITCEHPSFECFTPVNNWSIRPRALTYSRKDSGLTFTQIRLGAYQQEENGDVLFLSVVQAPSLPKTLVINIYNVPPGAINPRAGLSSLFSVPTSEIFSQTIIAGDFNLHHFLELRHLRRKTSFTG